MNKIDNKYFVASLTALSLTVVYILGYLSFYRSFSIMSMGRVFYFIFSYFTAFSSAYLGASFFWIFSKNEKGFKPFKIALYSSIVFSIGKIIIFSSMMVTMFMPLRYLDIFAPFVVAGLILLIIAFITYFTARLNCKIPVDKHGSAFSRSRFLLILVGIWMVLVFYLNTDSANYPLGEKPATVNKVQLDIQDTTLNLFSEEKNKELLLRHFASSVEWKVGRFNGNFRIDKALLCAVKKNIKGLTFETHMNGNMESPTEVVDAASIHFRFEEDKNKWKTTESKVGTINTLLTIDSSKFSGDRYFSAILIKGRGVDIYLSETGKDKKREFTKQTIFELNDLMKKLLYSETVKLRGFDPELMPKGSVIISNEPEVVITGSGGHYNIKGYINPSEKGFIYARAYNPKTKEDLINEYFKQSSIEYTGWSDNPKEKFSFDIETSIQSATLAQKAIVEIWFHSLEKECKDRKLISTEADLTAFRR
jgi:hypothetical protein